LPKKVGFDPDSGKMMIDGQTIDRQSQHEVARQSPPNANKPRAAGRRQATCSLCGSTEHDKRRHGKAA
jgi:hypothetical protein